MEQQTNWNRQKSRPHCTFSWELPALNCWNTYLLLGLVRNCCPLGDLLRVNCPWMVKEIPILIMKKMSRKVPSLRPKIKNCLFAVPLPTYPLLTPLPKTFLSILENKWKKKKAKIFFFSTYLPNQKILGVQQTNAFLRMALWDLP